MKSAFIRSLLLSATSAVLLIAGLQAGAKAADAEVPGEVLIRLRTTAALRHLLLKYQFSLVSQFGSRPIYRLKAIGLTDVHPKIEAMGLEPDVLSVEPNSIQKSPEARGNDAWAIGNRTAYVAQWAPGAMHLAEAHRVSQGAGTRVAVLDTGVDRRHPALAGRLLAGFDFVNFDPDASETGSRANISFGHGTHVAGLVAMVAPGARIMPLRVLDADGVGNAWVLAEAILYAVDPDRNPATDDGVDVINMSLGSTSRTRLFDSVAKLAACAIPAVVAEPADDFSDPGYNDDKGRCASSSGAVIVAAAGNEGSVSIREYPAAEGVYGLLAVGASNAHARLASFSNSGSWIDVAAPGDGLTSTVPGGGYGTWSGTSMAAPLAAGTAALLRSVHPHMQPRDITRRLVRSAATLCASKLRQVDAAAALLDARGANTDCR